MFEVEEAQHGELGGSVSVPGRANVKDRDHIHIVDHDFHCEKDNNETDSIEECAFGRDAVRPIAQLGDKIIKCENWTSEVERGVQGVGKVVAKAE